MKKDSEHFNSIKRLFKTHVNVDVFHITSDQQAFSREHEAHAHSRTLQDKNFITAKREDYEGLEESKVENSPVAPNAGDATTVGATTVEKPKAPVKPEKPVKAVDPEKAALQAKYTELFGKAPNHMTGVEKLKAEIAKKEAEAGSGTGEGTEAENK